MEKGSKTSEGSSCDADPIVERTKGIKLLRLPEDENQRRDIIEKSLSEPNVSSIDLTSCGIKNRDAKAIARGLALRGFDASDVHRLRLLDLSGSDTMGEEGVKTILGYCQDGFKRSDLVVNPCDDQHIYPETKDLIIRVSPNVDMTEELLEDRARRAPSVFCSGLTIIE